MENDSNPAAGDWFYAPAPPDVNTYEDLGNLTVGGETFAVRRRDGDGTIDYDWVSGPNDGYGFNSFRGKGPCSREQHVVAIREFLAEIDPATGYLRDP